MQTAFLQARIAGLLKTYEAEITAGGNYKTSTAIRPTVEELKKIYGNVIAQDTIAADVLQQQLTATGLWDQYFKPDELIDQYQREELASQDPEYYKTQDARQIRGQLRMLYTNAADGKHYVYDQLVTANLWGPFFGNLPVPQ